MEFITSWFKQHFSNPQVVYLGLFLLVLFAVLILMGQMIGPVLVGIVIAYLFSEVNNLHPVAIISAVLIFGSLWGLIGVFFAIPLATLVHAVINAWPKKIGAHPVVD